MLTLYGAMMSRAHRVVWMLKEVGIEYRHVPTSFLDGTTRSPEFLAINPNGRVPVIDDDGLVLFESMAINLYLANTYPSPLWPRTGREQALVTQWSFWVVTEVEKPLLFAAANRFLFAPSERNESEAAMALRRLRRPLSVLDAQLKRSPFLLGPQFSAADLNVSVVMTLMRLAGLDLSEYPSVDAWLTTCLERPAAADWKGIEFRIPRPASPLGVLEMFL